MTLYRQVHMMRPENTMVSIHYGCMLLQDVGSFLRESVTQDVDKTSELLTILSSVPY